MREVIAPLRPFQTSIPHSSPTDGMSVSRGSKPFSKPLLLSLWLTKHQKVVVEFLKTSIEKGKKNQVHPLVFHTCSAIWSTCNYKRLKEAAFCRSDKAAQKRWVHYLPSLSLLLAVKSSLSLSSAPVSSYPPPHTLQTVLQHLCVITHFSY